MDVEQRIEIAAPQANVWAVMTDVERWIARRYARIEPESLKRRCAQGG